MAETEPRVFTIPAGVPFVDALAEGLLARAGGDPLRLAAMTVLLPTRRAGRALREAFLRLTDGQPLLLPRMTPLGDVDADELALTPLDEAGSGVGDALDLPPALPPLRRELLLARLVLAWGSRSADGEAPSPAQATALAGELGRLLDHLETEGIDPARLADLGGDFARHWERTLDFLTILTRHWPELLAETGAMDAAARRDRLLRMQADRWRNAPPETPVIAAGSTGSIPATAALLAVVARLPAGMLVLPGLDRAGDPSLWPAIAADPSHPQHGMARLLDGLGMAAHAVPSWPWPKDAAPSPRARLIAEALRPPAATEVWTRPDWRAAAGLDGAAVDRALAGVARIDCAGPHEAAGVAALLMRETLETPGRTAALVTPDRALARRVAAELRRWDVEVDDSAGEPLGDTRPGALLRLVADAFTEAAAPVPLLAMLKHPLAAFGMPPGRFRGLVRRIELHVLRGPRPAPHLAGLADALAREKRTGLAALVARLDRATRPFADAVAAAAVAPADIVRAHVAAAEALAATPESTGAEQLWRGDAGEAAARFVAELLEAAHQFPPIRGDAYAGLLETLMAAVAVRPAYGRHPRLHIWGPLEARLQQADRLILGGLDEGTWPGIAAADPWLSRPMRAALGLPPLERRIGLAAHDFAQAAAAPEVFLLRAEKVDGTPTVPCRWLRRIDAVLDALGRAMPRRPDLADRQAALDDRTRDAAGRLVPRPAAPLPPPTPRPPVALRPRRLSVTAIQTWLEDPYAIYARHVLRLDALEALDLDPGAAERGEAIHAALHLFIAEHPPPAPLPGDARARLVACGERAMAGLLSRPIVRAFWWPRLLAIADWFLAEEAAQRGLLAGSWTERKGAWTLSGPAGPFLLTARADRIDRLAAGGLAIVDYKTGTAPTEKSLGEGQAPQMPLEAAMAAAGAFPDVPAASVDRLAYWQLTGGETAGKIIAVEGAAVGALAADAQDRLAALIAAYDDPGTPYLARPRPSFAPRFSDYGHLARVAEWSEGSGDGDGG
ncbi:MAG: double-strand break repair protein AddB [Alphaproteobacteria bacterium]